MPWAAYPLTQQLQQALRPFPQYNSIGINAGALNDGHITFNDFEATFEHRFSHGLYVLSSYTFSKLIGNVDSEIGNQAGAQNTYNRRLDKAVSSADRPQTLSIATVYDLPIGRGKALWGGMPKAVDAVIGSWRISAIQRYQSGGPLGVACAQNLFRRRQPPVQFWVTEPEPRFP